MHACAKINLGLNVVEKRPDGYHNLQTVFYPIPICDEIAMEPIQGDYGQCHLSVPGVDLGCHPEKNLVTKAYNLMAEHHPLPSVNVLLKKRIPSQAGMGGGSSDAAFMLKILNSKFNLKLTNEQLRQYAVKLGADCPFFIDAEPAYAEGIGEILTPMPELKEHLKDYHFVFIKPLDIAVSTREAFAGITPQYPEQSCRDIVMQPVECWSTLLKNDFETSVFMQHPELERIRDILYDNGAAYAAMTGSGSVIYGIFREEPAIFGLENKRVKIFQ